MAQNRGNVNADNEIQKRDTITTILFATPVINQIADPPTHYKGLICFEFAGQMRMEGENRMDSAG